jgi:Icc-related predicted phosphoesterase
MRVAAVGDVHVGPDSRHTLAPGFEHLDRDADVLLLAGDLTRCGTAEEAAVLGEELRHVRAPKLAVLGNHDHHDERPDEVCATLQRAGITVLEGDAVQIDVGGCRLGVAGVKGFGGGFGSTALSAFGERETKRFVEHTKWISERLRGALEQLDGHCDVRIALLHYAPVRDTIEGEPPEIHAFLGSQLLAEAIDAAGADLVLHGHAHAGTECGATPAGVPVRNVALPLLGAAYRVFSFDPDHTDWYGGRAGGGSTRQTVPH